MACFVGCVRTRSREASCVTRVFQFLAPHPARCSRSAGCCPYRRVFDRIASDRGSIDCRTVLRGHLGMERVDWTDLEDLYDVLNGRICTVRQFVALLGVNPREFLEIQRRCRIIAVDLAAALVFLKTYVVSDVGAVIFGVSTSTFDEPMPESMRLLQQCPTWYASMSSAIHAARRAVFGLDTHSLSLSLCLTH